MLNRSRATWLITRLVLSPSVAATNASARSMPAALRTVSSRAGPSVNVPGNSSPSRANPSGLWSMMLTSWPSFTISRASAEPTRPHPTIRTNTRSPLPSLRTRGPSSAPHPQANGPGRDDQPPEQIGPRPRAAHGRAHQGRRPDDDHRPREDLGARAMEAAAHGRMGPGGPAPREQATDGTCRGATMLAILIIGLIAGPAVSL